MKLLIACFCLISVAFFATSCGADDSAEAPAASASADTPAQPPQPVVDESTSGSPPSSGGIPQPCDRAVCNDFDQRAWIVDPPWERQLLDRSQVEDQADAVTRAKTRLNAGTVRAR